MSITAVKQWLYEVLEVSDKRGNLSWYVDFFLMLLIGLNVIMLVLETVESIYLLSPAFFYYFELISVIVFSIEYVLRVWTATVNPRFQRPFRGRIRYAATPLAVIDLLAVMPFYLPLLGIDLRFLRMLRMFRLFRLFKILRYVYAVELLRSVIDRRKEELTVSGLLLFFMLLFTSSIMFFIEHDVQPDNFSSIPATMWWGISTITTVGYGDVYPVTDLGKLLAGFIVVIGIGMIALPTGILVSGFMDQIEENKAEVKSIERCPHCGKDLLEHSHL